jgi:hypothetical protein
MKRLALMASAAVLLWGSVFLGSGLVFAQPPDFPDPFPEEIGEPDFGRPQQGLPPEAITAIVIVGVIGVIIGLAITIALILALASCFKRIPPQYRLMEPGMVWLLLIPCFNIVWIFFVYLRLPLSYQNYFRAHGRTDVGDCGYQLGLWYCISVVASVIPFVNYCAGPIALVLLIIYLVKVLGLKGQIPVGATS